MIRQPAVAGRFYPADPAQLRTEVEGYLAAAAAPVPGQRLRAVIAPHAGYMYSGPVAGYSYRQLDSLDRNRRWQVFLLGPAHRYPLRGVSVAAYAQHLTPLGPVAISPIAHELAHKLGFIPEADRLEHALEVQLPFLQCQLPDFELIPIVVGAAPPLALAQVLEPYTAAEDVLFVISTDLSHYHPYAEACRIDAVANEAIPALDLERMAEQGDACGIVGVLAAMALARDHGWQGHLLNYRNSGDTAGPRDQVVGYGAYSFTAPTRH